MKVLIMNQNVWYETHFPLPLTDPVLFKKLIELSLLALSGCFVPRYGFLDWSVTFTFGK